ncbi:MAG: glycosyltransferase family 4 protein [Nitrospiraceae bacterium]|nr:glycosyltransferase family 4 protein [Nitrospiraceae bacterium]
MRWFLFCYWYEPDAPSDPVGLVRLWTLARQLVERGDSVTVLPPRYRSALLQRGFSTAPIPLVPWPVLRPISYAILSCLVGFVRAWRSKPDVVYYRWMDSPHPLLFARLVGAQCVCEVNGEPVPDWSESDRTIKRRLKHWLVSFALSRCDRVVVLTDGLRDLVVRRYRVAAERVSVLPSGTDTGLFTPQDVATCRRRVGVDFVQDYIGFVGSFYRYQGLQCLLEAVAIVRRTMPSVHLLLVGDGEAAPELKQQAHRLDLTPYITWAGRIPYQEVPAWIGAMTLCVAPFRGDRGETSPVKIFDYLACGKPVIASAIPSVSAIFAQEAGVTFVPPDDPVSLAQVMLALLKDPNRQARMAIDGRRFVQQGFNWVDLSKRLRSWLATEKASIHHAHPRIL